ncbi:MAG: SRPBCC family protein [Capsulimonadales bacterium]|nr:SRPBCC family protein [Capsulimonadales bacterium]
MPKLEYHVELDAPVERVWAFYDRLETLLEVTPPRTRVRVMDPPERMAEGVHFTLIVSQPPIYLPLPWETYITVYEPPHLFIDEQGIGPFKRWRHEHRFEPLPGERTRLRDIITYEPPFGPLGKIADRWFVRRQLEAMFAHRHRVTRERVETPRRLI